jgi:membrane protease YdiL (CAAX protease family)
LKYAKLITILVVALQPAIFEELAFRGVLQEGLNKITDKKQAIFISAFLFTILHMSFISFFWLLPFALCLGYVRMKEETIWYGVLIHFCFNTTACFLEFFELNLF